MKRSKKIFNVAKKYIPGGVNSPVRAFSAVNDIPFFVKKSQGAYLTDIDNKNLVSKTNQKKIAVFCFETILREGRLSLPQTSPRQ